MVGAQGARDAQSAQDVQGPHDARGDQGRRHAQGAPGNHIQLAHTHTYHYREGSKPPTRDTRISNLESLPFHPPLDHIHDLTGRPRGSSGPGGGGADQASTIQSYTRHSHTSNRNTTLRQGHDTDTPTSTRTFTSLVLTNTHSDLTDSLIQGHAPPTRTAWTDRPDNSAGDRTPAREVGRAHDQLTPTSNFLPSLLSFDLTQTPDSTKRQGGQVGGGSEVVDRRNDGDLVGLGRWDTDDGGDAVDQNGGEGRGECGKWGDEERVGIRKQKGDGDREEERVGGATGSGPGTHANSSYRILDADEPKGGIYKPTQVHKTFTYTANEGAGVDRAIVAVPQTIPRRNISNHARLTRVVSLEGHTTNVSYDSVRVGLNYPSSQLISEVGAYSRNHNHVEVINNPDLSLGGSKFRPGNFNNGSLAPVPGDKSHSPDRRDAFASVGSPCATQSQLNSDPKIGDSLNQGGLDPPMSHSQISLNRNTNQELPAASELVKCQTDVSVKPKILRGLDIEGVDFPT